MRTFSIDPTRLNRYAAAREAGFAAVQNASEDLRFASQARQRLLQDARRRQEIHPQSEQGLTPAEADRLQGFNKEIAALQERYASAGEHVQHIGPIASRCAEYAEACERPVREARRSARLAEDEPQPQTVTWSPPFRPERHLRKADRAAGQE